MKKIIAALLMIIFAVSLTACSSGNNQNNEVKTSSESVSGTSDANQEEKGKKMDFSSMTVGKITKISGNQVTLELGKIDEESMTMPENMSDFDPENMPEGMSKPEGMSDFDPENIPEGMTRPEEMPDFDPKNMPEGMSIPEGMKDFDPENIPEGMSRPDGDNAKNPGGMFGGFNVEVKYTGETAKYTIPSEVKVGNGDYTSLSEGMVIGLGFDEDGIVNSVMIFSQKGN